MSDDQPQFLKTVRRRDLRKLLPRQRALVVAHSPDPSAVGRTFSLSSEALSFGRGTTGETSFDDSRMSRTHARVSKSADGLNHTVEDLDSSNGTFCDGVRVAASTMLRPGQVLSMGDTILVVDEEPVPDHLPVGQNVEPIDLQGLVGTSLAAQRLRRSLATVAPSPGSVLLLGPTGAGKEVAAQAIHELSGRAGRFVPVNCAAIPSELAEAELFGHAKGAFTGADREREGYFAQSDGGTLFLDEVGDLPGPVQAKLLRVLEDKTVRPLGVAEPRTIDLRIVAATLVNIENGDFRSDLLARLGDWTLRVPPLAERKVDVVGLFLHFLAKERPGARLTLTPECAEALLLHDWPMNVRELQKLAKRVATLAPQTTEIDIDLLPTELQAPLLARMEAEEQEETEAPGGSCPDKSILEAALLRSRGNVKQAADENGWHRTQLYRWLKKSGIDPLRYRSG